MKRFFVKLKNFLKYGQFKVFESLYNFTIENGDGSTILFDYNPKTGQYEIIK